MSNLLLREIGSGALESLSFSRFFDDLPSARDSVSFTATSYDAPWLRLRHRGSDGDDTDSTTVGNLTSLAVTLVFARNDRLEVSFDTSAASSNRQSIRLTLDVGYGIPASWDFDAVIVDHVRPSSPIPDYDLPSSMAARDVIDLADHFGDALDDTSPSTPNLSLIHI